MNHPKKKIRQWILYASLLSLVTGCSADQDIKQWQLPAQINEVSGLTPGPDGSVYLHDDEIAVVYEFQLDTGDVNTTFRVEQPAIEGDFEGIATTAANFFLITSEAELYQIPRTSEMLEATVSADVFDTGFSALCEVEGLHELNNHLYIACKTPYLKEDKKNIVLVEYSLESHSITNEIRLDLESLSLKKFSPSAIWLDEQSINLLSAKQRRLVQLSWSGEILQQVKLDKGRHPQPEGLSVIDGRFIIADEGDGDGGLITIYPNFPAD